MKTVLSVLVLCLFVGNLCADEPAATEEGFKPLFDGKDLTGWEGDKSLWSAENGEIIGRSTGIKQNEFLATTDRYGDFILKFRFRIVNTSGQANSGMQFRSERVPNSSEVSGYQADVGQKYWGSLYDESRRKKTLVTPPKDVIDKAVNLDGWNEYVITAQGPHITLQLNGVTTVDYTETEGPDKIARTGILALQIHAGGPMEVHAKDIRIKVLDQK